MARVRLTDRRRAKERKAVEDNIPYPGTVGQPGRKFKKRDQYDNWEEVVNHPLPDMRTEWREDKRDDIGFGISKEGVAPTVASIRSAASKSVKLAVLLLGDKVDEDVIEEQARDFMKLGNDALSRALGRFSETEKLYSQDEEEDEEDEEDEEEKKESKASDEDNTDDDSSESVKAEDDEEEKEDEEDEEEKKSSDEEEVVSASEAAELDIEVNQVFEDQEDPEAEKLLAEVFDDGIETASDDDEKEGIKKLGGQPKIASDVSDEDISTIWEDAPDVSDVFK